MLRILGKVLLATVALVVAAELVLQIAAPWAQFFYSQEDPLVRSDAIRILCVGDSNTYGLYLPRESSWPSQLQELLDRRAPGRYQVINLGSPGAPTSRIAENLPAFLARFRPHQVIVLAGVNDLLYGAIDAANPTSNWTERVRAFATTRIRLYRAWKLWQRSRHVPGGIRTDMDALNADLLSLRGLDDGAILRTLVKLYRDRGFAIREAGGDCWLENAGHSVHLNESVGDFRTQDLYDLTNAFIRMPMRAGYDVRDIQLQVQMQINGDEFDMEPRRGHKDPNGEIVGRNMALVGSLVRQADSELLVLTYASHSHFYGQVNRALRHVATDYDLPLLDIEPGISAQCPDDACTAFFFPDYHPNAEGYRQMARLIASKIKSAETPTRPDLTPDGTTTGGTRNP